ncbi:hypothetical protein BDV93DRAFT_55163 [Ceratobasidium sp. AG-I]|nr:hypothetical protein BDV93DRAFT_55163 [Ceratobasidium sp. AG-I]
MLLPRAPSFVHLPSSVLSAPIWTRETRRNTPSNLSNLNHLYQLCVSHIPKDLRRSPRRIIPRLLPSTPSRSYVQQKLLPIHYPETQLGAPPRPHLVRSSSSFFHLQRPHLASSA